MLLHFPAEVRNMICRYALTENYGLEHVKDKSHDKSVWLCIPDRGTATDRREPRVSVENISVSSASPTGTTGPRNTKQRRVVANQLQFVC